MNLNKDLLLWIYYDFANSIGFILASFYFPLYLIQDRKGSDYLISLTAIASTILLILTLPALGAYADKHKKSVSILKLLTLISISNLLILGSLIYQKSSIFTITFVYFVFLYVYQASIAFYNANLNENHTSINNESISGFGLAAGQFGNAFGLTMILSIAVFISKLLNTTFRESALIFSGFGFLIMVIPFLYFYKSTNTRKSKSSSLAIESNQEVLAKSIDLKSLKTILQDKNPATFLLSFFFFSDAILTLQIFASIILDKLLHFDDKNKTIVFTLGLLLGVTGGLITGKLTKFVNIRKLMMFLLFLSPIIIFLLSITYNIYLLALFIVFYSLLYGLLFSLSRIYYLSLIPLDKKAQYFSIYALFERLASILGPAVWAITIAISNNLVEETKYRLALAALGLLGLIGAFIFTKIKSHKD